MKRLFFFFLIFLPFVRAMSPDNRRCIRPAEYDYAYERKVVHLCLENKIQEVGNLLRTVAQHNVSETFFDDVLKALKASSSWRITTGCIVSSSLSGAVSAAFGLAIAPAECPCPYGMATFAGSALGFVPAALYALCTNSSEHESLLYMIEGLKKDQAEKTFIRPPAQLSMNYNESV